MKIVRFTTIAGRPLYGVWEEDRVRAIAGDPFGIWGISDHCFRLEEVTLILPPVEPPNVMGNGINWTAQAQAWRLPVPVEVEVVRQATTSITGRDRPLIIPRGLRDGVEYSVELALILRKPLFRADEAEARRALFGWTGAIRLSIPNSEGEPGPRWARGRSFDSTTSIGPFLQTEGDPDRLSIACRLNGETTAEANTSGSLFDCGTILSRLSHRHTLRPGDLILTGAIPFLEAKPDVRKTAQEGDVIEVIVEGVGSLSNPVVAA